MIDGSYRGSLLALMLGLFFLSGQLTSGAQETKGLTLGTIPDRSVAAVPSQKTAGAPASKSMEWIGLDQPTNEPFQESCKRIKAILDENKIIGPLRKILIGEMLDQHTGFPTPLSVFLRDVLRLRCQRFDDLQFADAPGLRGLEVVAKPKTTAALAELIGADVWLTGELSKTSQGLAWRINVFRGSGNKPLGVVEVTLPTEVLPKGVNIDASNLKEAQVNQKTEEQIAPLASAKDDGSLKIEVWVDRGRGAVYVEGDELIVMVRTNSDAYIRLFYTDAANRTYQVFPNEHHPEGKIRANVVTRIPEPQDDFFFRVKAPFGIESIMALASIRPLDRLKMATLDAGPFQHVQGGLRGLGVERRNVQTPVIVRDSVVLTTIPAIRTSDPSWD